MRARLSLRTQTKVGHQLVMASQLLRACGEEIEALVASELDKNPALELAHNDEQSLQLWTTHSFAIKPGLFNKGYAGSATAIAFEPSEFLENQASRHSVTDRLTAQLALMVARDELGTAIGLVHALDGYGYLRSGTKALAVELGVDCSVVERLISVLHQLEPPGIGARDLRECLLIQCMHLEAEGYDAALSCHIIRDAWDNFVHQRWGRVARSLHLSKQEVEEAWCFVAQNLYPYPLLLVKEDFGYDDVYFEPDLIIRQENLGGNGRYILEIPQATRFELCVSESFGGLVGAMDPGLSHSEKEWVQKHIERARIFMASLDQRWNTLRRLGQFLIDYQTDFLEHGPLHLKALTRAAVASELGLHESTISRAVSDKIVELPDGHLVPLDQFFDHALPVKECIRQLLARSHIPPNDREITERLRAQGFEVARRTVAKYRKQIANPRTQRRIWSDAEAHWQTV